MEKSEFNKLIRSKMSESDVYRNVGLRLKVLSSYLDTELQHKKLEITDEELKPDNLDVELHKRGELQRFVQNNIADKVGSECKIAFEGYLLDMRMPKVRYLSGSACLVEISQRMNKLALEAEEKEKDSEADTKRSTVILPRLYREEKVIDDILRTTKMSELSSLPLLSATFSYKIGKEPKKFMVMPYAREHLPSAVKVKSREAYSIYLWASTTVEMLNHYISQSKDVENK